MNLSEYLGHEWVPALGCTEPASIALAAATAADHVDGSAVRIRLVCDPRIYKNCYAVGIPRSEHRTGILWAAAIGASLDDPSLGLECFTAIVPETIAKAQRLLDADAVEVEVDAARSELYIDCTVWGERGCARAVIEKRHTNVARIERDGELVHEKSPAERSAGIDYRRLAASMTLDEMIGLADGIGPDERERLSEGIAMNMRIAEHGLTLFPERFVDLTAREELTRISVHVCAAVYARMWGEEFAVMTLAGSGNKGITASVPMAIWGRDRSLPHGRIEKALALACLVTSATTFHLGTLSAVCGCSNAAGIGLAAGLVMLEGGGAKEMDLAMNNMVGNVTGMICDGAKIGCALKTMTAVDAAFRASSLAMSGVGIPASDGIVGASGLESLKNLGRISNQGMLSADSEILAIMNEKLKGGSGV